MLIDTFAVNLSYNANFANGPEQFPYTFAMPVLSDVSKIKYIKIKQAYISRNTGLAADYSGALTISSSIISSSDQILLTIPMAGSGGLFSFIGTENIFKVGNIMPGQKIFYLNNAFPTLTGDAKQFYVGFVVECYDSI